MHVKLPTGIIHGTKLTARLPREREMVIVARAAYRLAPRGPLVLIEDRLAQGFLCGDRFRGGDDGMDGALEHASDFADFKPKADVLLRGSCWPGEGRASRDCTVKLRVGDWSKSLRVFGRRVWTERAGDPISNPAPFTRMPLTWANAFGGPAYDKNPEGRGLATEELPTVELPNALIRSKRDRPDPGSFGPVSPRWAPRKDKVGREYGSAWKKTRAPFFASDFDWSFFNAAPRDQQLARYLRGDEELAFEHLNPEESRVAARLPGVAVRAFVRYVDGATREAPMALDTLFADLDAGTIHLTWRGHVPVKDDAFEDVRTLYLALEPLDARRPEAEHGARLDAIERDPMGRESILTPEVRTKIAEAEAQAERARAASAPVAAADPLDAARAAIARSLASAPAEQRKRVGDVLDRLAAQRPAARAPSAPAAADTYAAGIAELARKRPLARTDTGVARIDAARAALEKGRAEQAAGEARAGAFVASLPVPAPSLPSAVSASAAPRVSAGEPQAGPGANLSGRDLTGADLRGLNLEGAILRGAKLARARLGGANLRRADLGGALLTGADLEEADLARANLSDVRAAGVRLTRAKLSQAIFSRSDLTGAVLALAEGQMALFLAASLTGAAAQGARLVKAVFNGATLDRADFSRAHLESCIFAESSAQGAAFTEARVVKTTFVGAALGAASFARAEGEGSSWQRAKLGGARFDDARLPSAHFSFARLVGARLDGAVLTGARFDGANLERASFAGADLRAATLNRAVVGETSFAECNLYDAKLYDLTALARCDFAGANVKGAQWELQ